MFLLNLLRRIIRFFLDPWIMLYRHWPKAFRNIALLSLLVMLLFTGSAQPADACFGLCIGALLLVGGAVAVFGAKKVIEETADAVGGMIVGVVSQVVVLINFGLYHLATAFAKLFTFVVYDVNQTIGFVDNVMVVAGWTLVRDVVNWFFVIIFLVAAIGTILDIQKYNARAILPRLLFVAVLVNFSLWITGFFVNVAQVITSLFVTVMANGADDIGQLFLNSAGLKNLSELENTLDDFWPDEVGQQLSALLSRLISSVFLGILTFVFGFLVIALLLRNIMLWILMILSPLAFVSAILPATQQFWSKWLKQFTQYTVFLPIAVFFIWLGTWLTVVMDRLDTEFGSEVEGSSGIVIGILAEVDRLMRFLTIAIFLFMSVIVTKWFAGEAGGIAQRAMGKASIAGLGGAALAGKGGAWLANRSRLTERTGNVIARIPGGGRLAERLYGTQRAHDTGRGAKQEARNMDALTDDQVKSLATRAQKSTKVMDRDVEIARQATARGIDLEDHGWSKKRVDKTTERLDKMGKGDEIIEKRLDLAARAGILKSQKDGPEGHETEAEQEKAIKVHLDTIDPRKFGGLAAAGFTAPVIAALKTVVQDPNSRFGGAHLRAMARNEDGGHEASITMKVEVLDDIKAKSGALPTRLEKAINDDPVLAAIFT